MQNAKKCAIIAQMDEETTKNQAPAEEQKEKKSSRGEKIWETVKVFVVPIAIVLFVRLYIAQPFIVKGASMEPSFEDQEYLIVDEITPVFKPLQRGTVVIFRYPLDPSEFFIKRIIGLPGERITIKNGEITITARDGSAALLREPYLARGTVTVGDVDMDIPEGQYFVLGDNRNFSSDSRRWGLLSEDFFIGRALLRLWPPEKAGIIKNANY